MALTDLAVRKLPHPSRGQQTYWDEHTPGFGVRLSQRSKSFVVMYGKDRRLKTIGSYPSKSLQDARKEAKRQLAQEAPQSGAMAFVDARSEYLEEAKGRLRPTTYAEYTRYLYLVIYTGRLSELSRQRVKQDVDTPHGIVALKVFFNWCIRNEYLDRNPLAPDRQEARKRKRRVLTPDELRQVWAYEDGDFTAIVKLLIIMGQRRTETSLIEEKWIEGNVVTIPGTVTKNHEDHMLPFGPLARRYLPPVPWRGWSKSKAAMDKVVKIPHWTLHDLRRTYRTIHAQIGTPPHIAERLLNHVSNETQVERVYNQYIYLSEMRAACTRYEEYLISICS